MKILIREDQYTRLYHFFDRAENRIGEKYLDLPNNERSELEYTLEKLYSIKFPKDKKIAYKLFVFNPNKKSKNYYVSNGIPYYRFKDSQGNLFIGDEVWVIVDRGNLVTLLVRKKLETKNKQRAKNMFNVDDVLFN